MIERIEQAAFTSVARACGFAGVGIVTFMIGFAGSPALCFKCGGILMLLLTAGLLLKARLVVQQPYRSTEVWLLLRQEDRPAQEAAQQVISGVLREVYLSFALHGAGVAAALLALTVVLQLFGATTKIM